MKSATYSDPTGTEARKRGASAATLDRLFPLAGVIFAVLDIAGDLVVDKFPDEHTASSDLTTYYAQHSAQVGRGGTLMSYAAIFLALFGLALVVRIWRSNAHPLLTGTALVGTTIACVVSAQSGTAYAVLGDIGGRTTTSAGALQAWHIAGATGSIDVGGELLLLAVVVAGLTVRAFSRWIMWSALVLFVMEFTPLSFLGSLIFHAWALVVGLNLCLRAGSAGAASGVRHDHPDVAGAVLATP